MKQREGHKDMSSDTTGKGGMQGSDTGVGTGGMGTGTGKGDDMKKSDAEMGAGRMGS